MVLFSKVYRELSLRIQQSLRRCNNRGAFQAHAGVRASRCGSPDQPDAERELGKSSLKRISSLSHCKTRPSPMHFAAIGML